MQNQTKHKPSFKIWLEHHGKPLIGKGGAQILEQIEKEHSISKAAKKLGMSYRYVWSYIKRVEKSLGKPILETYRGGRKGGGGAELTSFGKALLEEYRRVESLLNKALAKAEQ
ncbi:MAG: LysR family transcriptional regulator [Candidatus Bathyarchaeia archaeon]